MLNWIFAALVIISVLTGAFTGTMPEVSSAGISSAKTAANLALGLLGQMALWLGFMKVLQEAGLMRSIARLLKPIMVRLFPEVPAEHPAMSAVILNIVANMLGLANAATPFGIKAMIELNKLNKRKGVATNSMALFLAINTSGVAVLPLGVVAVRATLGASNISGIVLPSVLATMCSTTVGIFVAKLLEGMGVFSVDRYDSDSSDVKEEQEIKGIDEAEKEANRVQPWSSTFSLISILVLVGLLVGLATHVQAAEQEGFELVKKVLADWLLPVLMLLIVLVGLSKSVKVYEVFVAGAKEGFNIVVMIIPFLVAILVAIGMFRASGAMNYAVEWLGPVTSLIGLPAEALPMALIRPLSGSGALGIMMETMKANGPDSFVGFLVSVMNGSTETTFYVLAVYFGAVGVKAARHTVFACLAADMTGVLAATFFARLFF